MRVSFPHMGNLWIGLKALFGLLGHDVVVPPPCSRRTLDLGVRHGPESICLPMKLNIGNFIEALELGADCLVMPGGVGPCRFGFYAHVEEEILKDLGFDFQMIVLDPPHGDWARFRRNLAPLIGSTPMTKVIRAAAFAWHKIHACDLLDRALLLWRGRTTNPKRITAVYREALEHIDEAGDLGTVTACVRRSLGAFRQIAADNPRPDEVLTVALAGEIYTVLEPFANLQVEELLADMGVMVKREIFADHWIIHHVVLAPLANQRLRLLVKQTRPFLNYFVGGHGLESVATARTAKDVDGVIHVLPFTCMPEIVAQSVMPKVSRERQIPVMTLVVDEHSAEAGLVTRVEAFVDMLRQRKRRGEVDEHTQTSMGSRALARR